MGLYLSNEGIVSKEQYVFVEIELSLSNLDACCNRRFLLLHMFVDLSVWGSWGL